MPSEITQDNLSTVMADIAGRTREWLERQRRGRPIGVFSLCDHALVDTELNAITGGVELWTMLGLPMTATQRAYAVDRLRSYQNPASGLVSDSTWVGRERFRPPCRTDAGDTFFTMTAQCALESLGSGFAYPVDYAQVPARQIATQTLINRGAHHPWAIGDLTTLLRLNDTLRVPGSAAALDTVDRLLTDAQDPDTGLWNVPTHGGPLTPSINLAFHHLRRTRNLTNRPYQRPEKMINSCLAAAGDDRFYGWDTGYACNDLDLVMVIYGASRWTAHRSDEIKDWARRTLPVLCSVQKPDGGFSFFHDHAMTEHGGIAMSAGRAEGDMWGTLMYLGAIKLLTELAFPGLTTPWACSAVHAVPTGQTRRPSNSSRRNGRP